MKYVYDQDKSFKLTTFIAKLKSIYQLYHYKYIGSIFKDFVYL